MSNTKPAPTAPPLDPEVARLVEELDGAPKVIKGHHVCSHCGCDMHDATWATALCWECAHEAANKLSAALRQAAAVREDSEGDAWLRGYDRAIVVCLSELGGIATERFKSLGADDVGNGVKWAMEIISALRMAVAKPAAKEAPSGETKLTRAMAVVEAVITAQSQSYMRCCDLCRRAWEPGQANHGEDCPLVAQGFIDREGNRLP